MNLWEKFDSGFRENASRNAFCIAGRFYTYSEFTEYISGSRQMLQKLSGETSGIPVGVMCHDTIETYAAIFAIWFSGAHFVPLHPQHPTLFNQEKVSQSGVEIIFDSTNSDELQVKYICNKGAKSTETFKIYPDSNRAYILFTSGSTGKPKGVPINERNLYAFIMGFLELYPDLNSDDLFLQTYELTSDAAFTGYLIPLLLGATVFTTPSGGFKYLSILKYLNEYPITWTQFTPSVLNYLRPYFNSIRIDSLKHSHFGGEALPVDLVSEWAKCVPNAEISNIYGPTETTITCTIHRTTINQLKDKVYKGFASIGKPLKEVKILIIGENDQIVSVGEKGELCIGGNQVMEGYLTVSADDKTAFIFHDKNYYYRSGDLVIQDIEGYLFYCGRKDDQLKISGYRIEPAEIETAISEVTNGLKSKVYGFTKNTGITGIVAFIENFDGQPNQLKSELRSLLPLALIPEKIIAISQFPLNSNGKADKTRLLTEFSTLIYD